MSLSGILKSLPLQVVNGGLLLLFSLSICADEWRIDAWHNQQLMLSRPLAQHPGEREMLLVVDSPAPPQAMLNLMLDYRMLPKWMLFGQLAKPLAQPAANYHQMYTRLSPPWPLSDRDLVTESHFWREQQAWWLEVQSRPQLLAENNDALRIRQMETCWAAFTSDLGSRIFYLGYLIDPGKVPGFAVWEMRKTAMQQSLQAFVDYSQLPHYQRSPDYVSDPELRGWGYCERLRLALAQPRIKRLLR